MKHFLIRSQLVFVSIILLLTFAMMMAIVMQYNQRWDFTREKIYSLAKPTQDLLQELDPDVIEVFSFYPNDDPARENFDVFLKECQLKHTNFRYYFYDPDRVPSLAKKYNIKEHYTVVIRYQGRQERIIQPTEESFSNALLRLAHPKQFEMCFVMGHGESPINEENRNGYKLFNESLLYHNYKVHEVILSRDKIPSQCNVLIIGGPHRDLDTSEFDLLRSAFFKKGLGILMLIDPMDPGAGAPFRRFLEDFGITLGEDVIVDKMSRMVGGDFLVPLVDKYVIEHPITDGFEQATFFPVARSVQPATKEKIGVEVVPLALSGSGSWAESKLEDLEKGEAAFEAETDLSGPIPIAVSAETTTHEDSGQGRMVVIGDSDFVSNAYLQLSGNHDFALNIVQWLTKDDRFISIRPKDPEFQPLFIDAKQRIVLLVSTVIGIPLLFMLLGVIKILIRKRTA